MFEVALQKKLFFDAEHLPFHVTKEMGKNQRKKDAASLEFYCRQHPLLSWLFLQSRCRLLPGGHAP